MTAGLREMGAGSREAGAGTSAPGDRPAPVLVLGLGNLLLGDDAIGLRLLERLAEGTGFDGAVEFVDGGTQGLALLGHLEHRKAVLVLDAVGLGAEPGTVHVLRARAIAQLRARRASSAHEGNALELLETARVLGFAGNEVAVVVVGVEPANVRTGMELTPSAERSIGEGLARAREILEDMVQTYVPRYSR